MLEHFWPLLFAVIGASGFWEIIRYLIASHRKKLTDEQKLILGIAHDRIWYLGRTYISRGGVTASEFDNIQRFAGPYIDMGGNGSGKKIWDEVQALPIISDMEAERRDALGIAAFSKVGQDEYKEIED